MGQRSQIYVRYEGKLIIARYYQWNYGERMISRARYGIEYIKRDIDKGYTFCFTTECYINRYIHIFDTNFDMKDVEISTDIFKEFEEWKVEEPELDFKQHCFTYQDNNDGKLLIDISGKTIKYAFLDSETDIKHIMSARQYMDWDSTNWRYSKYIGAAGIRACKDNIQSINSMARLMTEQEVIDFLQTDDYFGKSQSELMF